MKYKIGFIGAGNMAFALIKSVKKLGPHYIIASDIDNERLGFVREKTGIETTKDNKEVVKRADIIFIAVKPQSIDGVLDEIKDVSKGKLIVSIAAGVKIERIEKKLKEARVIRVMPNTPCLVGEMAAGFAVGDSVKDDDIKAVEEILNSSGKAFYLNEEMLDAVTGLSGSGPAFVAKLIEAFIEAGVSSGLSRDISSELTIQTFKGTSKLLQESGMTPDELVKLVSSPGGTTIAGIDFLEKSDYKEVIKKTIEKAVKRSKELAK